MTAVMGAAVVVVLDDHEVILDMLRAVIADTGREVIVAPALAEIPEGVLAGLVITDLVPLKAYRRETALAWIAALRARFPGAPVVVLTAHAGALEEPDKLGADAILGKPFDLDALLALVDDHVVTS